MRDAVFSFFIVCFLVLPTGAFAQIQQLVGGQQEKPGLDVKLTSGAPHDVARAQKKVLLERQQALFTTTGSLDAARSQMAATHDRAEQVRQRIVALREKVAQEQEALHLWEQREIERKAQLEGFRAAEALRLETMATSTLDEGPPVDPVESRPAPSELVTPEQGPEVTHPSYLGQLEWLAGLLERKASRLDGMIAVSVEQREMLAGALLVADRVLERHQHAVDQRTEKEGQESEATTLGELRSLLYDLHLARLELALARSRERSTKGEQAGESLGAVTEAEASAPEVIELADNADSQMRTTFDLTLRVRDEAQEIRVDLARINSTYNARRVAGRDIRARSLRLDVLARQQRVTLLSEQYERAIKHVTVTPEERRERRTRHEKWNPLIEADIERTEAELAHLRSAPEVSGGGGIEHFSAGHLWELRVAALEEERNYHLLRRERLHFTTESFDVIAIMIAGRAPDSPYMKRHAQLLKEPFFNQRLEDISQRQEAWRRQRAQFARKEVDSLSERTRGEVLELTQRIADFCSDQEAVLESDGRLASIVRHYLQRYERASRGWWWYLSRVLLTLLTLVGAVVLSIVVGRLALGLSRVALSHAQLPKRLAGGKHLDVQGFYRGAKRSLVFGLYLLGITAVWLGAFFVMFQLTWDVDLGLGRLGETLDTPLFLVGETQVTPGSFVKLFVALVLAFLVARLTQAFLRGQVFRFFEWDEGVRHAVSVILRYVVLFIGIALGLEYVGIGLSTFAVLLGVVGIGIGFGLQHIANNFISGFVILFERPVKKGDFVAAGELEGEVLAVSARATTVRTRDNISVIVPNSEFVSGRVINWSHEDPRIRLRIPVGTAYGSDVAKVEEVLLSVARNEPQVLEYPASEVWFTKFGESSLDFELLAWTKNIRDRFAIASDLNKAIVRGFREADIRIPFPQRDVYVKELKEGPGSKG